MKFCYECGRITAGVPLFCTFCGRSYDVRLCPGKHVNPRFAEVCSRCGSRDLSTPQPKVPFSWRLLEVLIRIALVLLAVCVALGLLSAVLQAILQSSQIQNVVVALGILFGLSWWLWSKLPNWIRKALRSALKRKDEGHER